MGDLPLYQQVELLRVLETSTVTRLGSTQDIAVTFRLVAATNKNLIELVQRGVFRADLYYRLAVIKRWVPSLDERGPEEKKALFRSLLARHQGAQPVGAGDIPAWLLDRVAAASSPGNVRELSNVIERIALVRRQLGRWDPARIERVFARLKAAPCLSDELTVWIAPETVPLGNAERAERARVLSALQAKGWRRQDTAQQLGISRKVLWEKMRKLQLNSGQSEAADDPYATSS